MKQDLPKQPLFLKQQQDLSLKRELQWKYLLGALLENEIINYAYQIMLATSKSLVFLFLTLLIVASLSSADHPGPSSAWRSSPGGL